MPPHCDTKDGPVVSAARVALDTGNVNFVLIWVPESAENELKEVFEKTLRVRKTGAEAQAVVDEWFLKTSYVCIEQARERRSMASNRLGLIGALSCHGQTRPSKRMTQLTQLASLCKLSKTTCSNGSNAPSQQRTMV